MYQELFVYRVPENRADDFERVVGQAIEVFRRHGALGGELVRVTDDTDKFGCRSMGNALGIGGDEVLYVEVSYFHDKAHHERVSASTDADPEVVDLFEVLVKTVDIQHVARSEFSSAVRSVDHAAMAAHASI
ncbi:DUF1428 family protein [Saccharothrix lopnurensis]|uniref:DUF1428 family protein n=1 Tax=Saccharothrix lopnurensis TaxID=1670621 RepID=A0ABW1PD48_9PSEU